jgi:hypothetical protein
MRNHNRQMNNALTNPICEGVFSYVWGISGLFGQGGFYASST